MVYELVLICVVIQAGYQGLAFVRERPHGTATFGVMQLAAAGLAGLGLIGCKIDAAWLGFAGAIGAGAGACLLVLGPLVRVVARRLVAAERIGIATRLLDLAELLAPGSGVAEEKALLHAMAEIREGRIEQTVDALTAAKQRAPAGTQLAIDERIAMLYVTAYRWSDAIAHAEAHLFGAEPPPGGDGDGSLRAALGVAPPVWVELLGAYGRIGDLDQAARMVARLEDVCAGRDDAALWIHRARVMFLALAGRTDAVRALVAPSQARHMSAAARSYWMAVALDHHGDGPEAARAYKKARGRSRGRPRELIDHALAKLAQLAEPRRTELAAVAHAVVARIEAAPLPSPIPVSRLPRQRATWQVIALLLAVSATTALAIGETSDLGVMIRAGALVRGLVAGGEWWRVVTCLFVHVGAMHLICNVTGMVILGRLAEEVFGSARMMAIFGAAGLAGALASYLASPSRVSAGASGAVLGLLGAVFIETTWQRRRFRSAWMRGMWGRLAVVLAGLLGYGLFDPTVDQWAHGAALVAGSVLGFVLSPSARWSGAGRYLARAIALGFGVLVVISGVQVVRTSLADSLAREGTARRVVGEVAISVPPSWEEAAGQVVQPDVDLVIKLARQPRANQPQQIATWLTEERRRSRNTIGELTEVREPIIALPAGWEGIELSGAPEDTMGYHQRMRVIVCGKAFADTMVFMAIQVPETVARAAPAFLTAVIASTGPA